MRSRALRVWLFACVAFALWAVALPARAASAPYCDDRGASALASPPVLQPPEEAMRAALAPRAPWACSFEEQLASGAVAHGHRTVAPAVSVADVASPSLPRDLAPANGDGLLPEESDDDGAPTGVRCRVERPPRG